MEAIINTTMKNNMTIRIHTRMATNMKTKLTTNKKH